MARLFRGHEDAVARSIEIVERCRFSLDELRYEYPDEPVPEGHDAATAPRRARLGGRRRTVSPSVLRTALAARRRGGTRVLLMLRSVRRARREAALSPRHAD